MNDDEGYWWGCTSWNFKTGCLRSTLYSTWKVCVPDLTTWQLSASGPRHFTHIFMFGQGTSGGHKQNKPWVRAQPSNKPQIFSLLTHGVFIHVFVLYCSKSPFWVVQCLVLENWMLHSSGVDITGSCCARRTCFCEGTNTIDSTHIQDKIYYHMRHYIIFDHGRPINW